MSLPTPNLDDRDFDQLVADARRRIAHSCPGWTDVSPSDPGMVLVEVFAHLTETLIYRLNRVPAKAYIEFLRLIGTKLRPPSAAAVRLVFHRPRPESRALEIPRGTRVTVGGSATPEPPVFATAKEATIAPGQTVTEVLAYHAERVLAEPAGEGTGLPGLSVQVRRPPIVASTGGELDLVVGVEAGPGELADRVPAVRHEGTDYRVWREVDTFTNLGADRHVYVVDRLTGVITFAPSARLRASDGELEERPAALAEVPAAGRRILVWYPRGGGAEGNVAAGTLIRLKDPIPGLEVTNPEPGTGGKAAENLANALVRGPQELHSLERAVTGRDFELLALRSSGAVARAKAITRAQLWAHAQPGTVEVLLVPDLPAAKRREDRVAADDLASRQTEDARTQIQRALDERRPLGTSCLASWARYKTVRARARVVVHPHEDAAAVERRVLRRLHASINPLPSSAADSDTPGWPFGRALWASHVYDIVLSEPGVSHVDRVRLRVEQVPGGAIRAITADLFQSRTWYAGCVDTLFRSGNDGDGWEPVGRFGGGEVRRIGVHPARAGLLAVATRHEGESATLHVSRDCGESWEPAAQLAFDVEDLAWVTQDGVPALLLATDKGLFAVSIRPGSTPVQVPVVPENPELGFYAVTAVTHVDGAVNVAVAAQQTRGVYLSIEEGRGNSFRKLGLDGEDVRVLAVQADGPRRFLWAGAAAAGGDPGAGCFSRELLGSEDSAEGWQHASAGWNGGSCHALAFLGATVVAASHQSGVLRLDSRKSGTQWQPLEVRAGLPLRDPGRFHPTAALAADREGRRILAGTTEGVFRSDDGGASYQNVSRREFDDQVTLPETWLFCSGDHEIEVTSEDAASGD